MNLTFKEAVSEDYSVIAEIYNEHIKRQISTMDEHHYITEDIASWVNNFNSRERLYVVTLAEKIVGWGIIKKYSDRKGYRYAAETAVYLTESVTGRGIGSEFKKFIIAESKKLKYHHLVAKIFNSNQRSIQYNLSLGYDIVGIQKEIGFKDGAWQDVCIMQLVL